jgi:hypothetical protein
MDGATLRRQPIVKSTYWPPGVNFERLGRSRLDWRLLCPGSMVDEPDAAAVMLASLGPGVK